ncbi:DUF456 domain-containing protein [Guptibacillus sedimenti]|uniref:DUF456 domain-containing protein n=1 Tax=Guptibacillus sedimenti TaxID=3025680 RepID=UPI00235F7395|nr:DUF456 domain-containing protein [Pseudalkalibacillus sedimenti]
MKSYSLLNSLKEIPKVELTKRYKKNHEMISLLDSLKNKDVIVQSTIYSSIIGYQILETRNIPDDLFDAYASQYPKMFSSGTSLYDKYIETMDSGEYSVLGLVNAIKGKFFEYHVKDELSIRYPDFDFSISPLANQPLWDIKGVNSKTNEEVFIQVKMMTSENSYDLTNTMLENPNIYYATSSEIREKILHQKPELEEQFIPIEVSNYEFTIGVKDGLETLKENMGIDVPDEVFALAPYSTEIVLGVRLLYDLALVNRDFRRIKTTEKARLAAVKVLILFSRFGVNTILGIAGSSLGTVITPGIGTAIGGVSGVIVGSMINKKIAPYSLELAYKLLYIDEEDMFYYKNIDKVHDLAYEYRNERLSLQSINLV